VPDVNACKCDSNTGWDAEEEWVMDAYAMQMVAKDALDETEFNEASNKRQEWNDLLLDNCPNLVSINNVDQPPPPQMNLTWINFNERKMMGKVLADLMLLFVLLSSRSKRKLFEKLFNSDHIMKLDDDSFECCGKLIAGWVIPVWQELMSWTEKQKKNRITLDSFFGSIFSKVCHF
jgi:hypothetical protein